MSYQQDQTVKALDSFLQSWSIPSPKSYMNEKAIEADRKWSASLFWARIIARAAVATHVITEAELQNFHRNFQTENNLTIDLNDLFEKFWLRNILGHIHIPRGTRTILWRLDKLDGAKQEFDFMIWLREAAPDVNELDRVNFINKLNEYRLSRGTSLNPRVLFTSSLIRSEKRKIQFLYPYEQEKILSDNWNVFQFLQTISKLKGNNRGYIVKQAELSITLRQFSAAFDVPTEQELLDQGFIHKLNDHEYNVTLRDSKPFRLTDLSSRIAAFFWEQLHSEKEENTSPEVLVKLFLYHTSQMDVWPNFLEYCNRRATKTFLDGACSLILAEPDLDNSKDQEFARWQIDSDNGLLFNLVGDERYSPLNTSDYFELFQSIKLLWDDDGNYFHLMDTRQNLDMLIATILRFDNEGSYSSSTRFERITDMLQQSLSKPFLLYYIFEIIVQHRKQALPYLLTRQEFMPIIFLILDDIDPRNELAEFMNELWRLSLDVAITTISLEPDKLLQAKMIFQTYRAINRTKFQIPNPNNPNSDKQKSDRKNRETYFLNALEKLPLLPNISNRDHTSQYLLPSLLNQLVTLFEKFDHKPRYNNGTLEFPYLRWDAYFWIMKMLTYFQYRSQMGMHSNLELQMARIFSNDYLRVLETRKIEKYDYFNKTKAYDIPNWRPVMNQIRSLDWMAPIQILHRNKLLSRFITPRIDPIQTDDLYNEENKFVADKLRSHVGVLIISYQRTIESPSRIDREDLKKVRTEIENQIISYVKLYSVNDPKNARVDLFSFHRETRYHTSDQDALLPEIARVINVFQNRKEIVDAIADSNDVAKILTTIEWCTVEGIKKMLIDKVKVDDLASLLNRDSHWIPEVQNALVMLRSNPEFIIQLKRVLEFWEGKVTKRNSKYEKQVFETKLLMAYFNRSQEELQAVNKPSFSAAANEVSFDDYRNFYYALIVLSHNPSDAYRIFDTLAKRYPSYPVMALNRMIAKTQMAERNNDDAIQY